MIGNGFFNVGFHQIEIIMRADDLNARILGQRIEQIVGHAIAARGLALVIAQRLELPEGLRRLFGRVQAAADGKQLQTNFGNPAHGNGLAFVFEC